MNARKSRVVRFNARASYGPHVPGSFASFYRREKRAYNSMNRQQRREFTIVAVKPASFRVA